MQHVHIFNLASFCVLQTDHSERMPLDLGYLFCNVNGDVLKVSQTIFVNSYYGDGVK